jgi:hypothetical protein
MSVSPYSCPLRAVGERLPALGIVSISCLLLLLFPGSVSNAGAADVRQLGIAKVEYFIQTADAAPTYNGPGAFAFYAFVDQAATNAVPAAFVNLPDAQSETLASSEPPLTLDFLDYYDNPVALDLRYPPGPYSISVVGTNDGLKSISFDLPESFFPNAPRLLDWPALQAIQADKPFGFRWEPFAEGQGKDLGRPRTRCLDRSRAPRNRTPGAAPGKTPKNQACPPPVVHSRSPAEARPRICRCGSAPL